MLRSPNGQRRERFFRGNWGFHELEDLKKARLPPERTEYTSAERNLAYVSQEAIEGGEEI
jgi:hypothetical protein